MLNRVRKTRLHILGADQSASMLMVERRSDWPNMAVSKHEWYMVPEAACVFSYSVRPYCHDAADVLRLGDADMSGGPVARAVLAYEKG